MRATTVAAAAALFFIIVIDSTRAFSVASPQQTRRRIIANHQSEYHAKTSAKISWRLNYLDVSHQDQDSVPMAPPSRVAAIIVATEDGNDSFNVTNTALALNHRGSRSKTAKTATTTEEPRPWDLPRHHENVFFYGSNDRRPSHLLEDAEVIVGRACMILGAVLLATELATGHGLPELLLLSSFM